MKLLHRIIAVLVICGVSLALLCAAAGEAADVKVQTSPGPQVRYTSGKTLYVRGLVGERWVGRYWTADGRINVPYELYANNAFELQIESQWLSTGWQWVNANEAAPTRPGQRHFVVELSNRLSPVRLKVHPELDGTPALVRWLELSNSSRKPIALTAVYPWSARLWRSRDYQASLADASEPVFRLGYFNQISHGWEGWSSGVRSKTRPYPL